MRYTIEQIEKLIDGTEPGIWRWDSDGLTLKRRGGFGAVLDMVTDRYGKSMLISDEVNRLLIAAAPDLARQLLETMRELAAANAKIERALAIPEESYYENMPPSAAMVAANDMREQFRAVLTSTP